MTDGMFDGMTDGIFDGMSDGMFDDRWNDPWNVRWNVRWNARWNIPLRRLGCRWGQAPDARHIRARAVVVAPDLLPPPTHARPVPPARGSVRR